MTKMTDNLYFSMKLGILIFVGVLVFSTLLEFKSSLALELITLKTDGGWGYNILSKGKIYIHQPYIPAVNGNQAFNSVNDAQKTGSFVLEKLKKGEMPTIKVNELDSLNIKYMH